MNAPSTPDMGVSGVFREIVVPARIVCTERYDEAWYAGDTLITNTLTEVDGVTTCTIVMRYDSTAARDSVLASPMEEGLSAGFVNLDRVLSESR